MTTVESHYGSDKHGLVWGYRFAPGATPVEITPEQVPSWLESTARTTPESFLWLHFSLSNAASERWLRQVLSLPDEFYQSLSEHASSTRVEQEGDTLVAVIHDALFHFTLDPESISTVNLCMTPQLLITARLRPVRSVDRLRGAVRAGQEFHSPADLLAQLLRHQADVLVDIVRTTTTRVDLIEDKILANRIPASRRDLGEFRRTLVRLQRLLAPEPASFFRLLKRWLGGMPGWTMTRCEFDLRVGGAYRYEWLKDDGTVMGMSGTLSEVVAPKRMVATERFDQSWYPGEGLVSQDLTEQGGKTTVTMTLRYESKEARDMVVKSGATSGMEFSYARLDELLAATPGGKK